MLIQEGFPGQRLRVLPAPLVAKASAEGLTACLLVTDAGRFPRASNHGRLRPGGAAEAIVILCIEGLGWCEIDDQLLEIPAGTALVIPPGVPHLYRADARNPWTIWWLHATGRDVPYLLDSIDAYDGTRLIKVRDVFRAVAAIEHALECLEHDETQQNLLSAAGNAWMLFAQLAADHVSGGHSTEPIQQALAHLRENFAAKITIDELARMAGLSRSYFATLFKAATGYGVIEYVKSLRMARARELLITTPMSIAEIGRGVGYDDPFYFSRQFHAVHGCSPTVYRADARD